MKKTYTQVVADLEKGLILAEVTLEASPERVYQTLSDAAEIPNWWGEDNVYHMRDWIADLKKGGLYTVNVVLPDGTTRPASGEFLAVQAPNRFSHTRRYDWDHPTLGRNTTIITYMIAPKAGGSTLTVRHEGFAGFPEAATEHAGGWERVLIWLAIYLNPGKTSKSYFALQLIPARPTFSQDMSEEEKNIMRRHVGYWQELMRKGEAVVFGPVLNPAGAYGLGIVGVEGEAQVQALIADDPANGLIGYEFHPMLAIVAD
jgi:uncharacterized protein YndB with AHSA1/START domain